MKKTSTILSKFLLLAAAWGAGYSAWGQTYTPVPVTGFNQDVIAEGTSVAAPAVSTYDVDGSGGAGYCFMVTGYSNPSNAVATQGLPTSGTINSASVSGLSYQLAPYSANNSLRIPATGNSATGSGTLTLTTATQAADIYLLNTGGGGATTSASVTVSFSDGTSQSFTGQTIPDWYTVVATDAMIGLGRVARTAASGVDNNTAAPRLHQLKLTLASANQAKYITSITVAKTATGTCAINIFAVSVSAPTLCAGTPTAGTAVAGVTTACSSTSIALSLSGATTSGGISYQWQASTDAGATFNPIAGATGATYTATGQTTDTQYRAQLTCAVSGTVAYSTAVTVTQNPFYSCTCAPTSTATNEYLTNVTLGSINNSSTNQSSTAPVDYTTTGGTTTLSAGGTYPISVSARYNNTASSAAVWIDYDHSGTFDASEFTLIGSGPVSGSAFFYTPQLLTLTGALAVPATALTGVTKMRVRWKNGLATSGEACTSYSGETEDYLITIGAATACSGAPAVTVTGAPSSICPNTGFALSVAGANATSGVTYQWQSSPAGAGTFANINPANYPSATTGTLIVTQTAATDYQVVATCAGASATSSPVTVGLTPFANCYCTPSTASVPTSPAVAASPAAYLSSTNGAGTYGIITSVAFSSAGNTAFTASPGASSTSPYYANNTSGATGSLAQGTAYTVSGTVGRQTRLVAWIDYDHSGTFDASEYTLLATNTATTAATYSVTLTIPGTALNGATRLRFRTEYTSSTALLSATATNMANSCATTAYGQTVDYAITITPATACAGTPTAVATAAATSACANTAFTLTASGPAAGTTGLSYQWQSRPTGSGAAFANITANATGATTAVVTITSQTVATDYQVLITCANGGAVGTSNTVAVSQNSFMSCYCQPTSSSVGEYVSNITVGSINNTTGNSVASTPVGYTDYTANPTATQTTTLTQLGVYPVSLTAVDNRINSTGMLWIDYDHSGTYDATNSAGVTEYLLIGSGPTSGTFPQTLTFTNTLTIPASALLGQTHMRVRWHNDASTAADACTLGWNGETEEYLVTIAPSQACSGTPAATTATATASSVCAGTAFTLSATGGPNGTTGLTYQWQSSPAGAGTFTSIGGATTLTYTVASQTAATDYQLLVTCTASGQTTASSVVTVGQNSFMACYCVPTYSSGGGTDNIANVTLGTLSNTTSGNTSPYYHDYSATQNAVPDLIPGGSATVSLTFGSDPNQYSAVWIDFNHSGVFEAGEYFTAGTNPGVSGTVGITVAVPASALAGQTKMRVRGGDDNQPTSGQACGASSSNYGEAEDYLVNVLATTACTGTPATTTASASVPNACTNVAFTLSATGIAAGTSGLTYQWQSSPAGAGAFANISGATANTYTVANQTAATDYQLVVTCTASALSAASNVVAVGQNGYLSCYPAPVISTGTNEYIRSVNVNGTSGFTNTTNATAANGYNDFTSNPSLTTTLSKGSSYPLTITVQANNAGSQGALWIDYDHSGTFDASEYFNFGGSNLTGTAVTFTPTYAVPNTAGVLTGTTRMRLRWRNGTIAATDGSTSGATAWYGETEDYLLTIADATTPLPVQLLRFTATLSGPSVRLDWATASEKNSDRFEIERSTDGVGFGRIGTVAAAGTTSAAHTYALTDAALPAGATTLYYRLRQVDLDGTATYSPVRPVQLASELALFPNPAHTSATLAGAAANAPVQVLDVLNRLVLATQADATGQANLQLPAGLASGVYLVRTGSHTIRLLLH